MKWHRQLAILGAASLLLGLTGCSGSSANTDPISYTGTALDTVISIKIYDSQDNNLNVRRSATIMKPGCHVPEKAVRSGRLTTQKALIPKSLMILSN